MNKDGYADVIIGAYTYNNSAGVSYIIFGNKTLTDIDITGDKSLSQAQGISILGANSNDQSGSSVSGACDINNDGYSDVIIGAPFANSHAGISYVVYGGTALPSKISLKTLGTQGFSIFGIAGSYSGTSVSCAGNVNKDEYDDIIIGAPNANSYAGISYVIYGGAELSDITLPLTTLERGFSILGVSCTTNYAYSGSSVSRAGDINSDGYDDVIIGAPLSNNCQPMAPGDSPGVSYVIFGGVNITNINLVSLTLNQGFYIIGATNDGSGRSVSGAIDINQDGYDDLIIGAPGNTDPYKPHIDGTSYIILVRKAALVI